MQAKDVMTKKPEFLPPTATLKEVALSMKSHDFGFVPIGENDRLVGTITDRDITVRAIAKGKDPNKTIARDIMTEKLEYCFDTDDLGKVVSHMQEAKVRRIVVLNKSKRMVGIISLGDIACKGNDAEMCGSLTEEVSQ